MTGNQHRILKNHLHPGDCLEAAALGLCGITTTADRVVVTLYKIEIIPYDKCKRSEDRVSWDGRLARTVLEEAMQKDMAVVKFHSHPSGYDKFSEVDDEADKVFAESAYGWSSESAYHSSLVMLPEGRLFGRWYNCDSQFYIFDRISVVDHHLFFFDSSSDPNSKLPEQYLRNIQAFGNGTTKLLQSLKIGVVGCSGTGSPLIEILVRMGIGELVLIDPDKVELKNLNRIINAKLEDAESGRLKTEMLETIISKMGFDTKVKTLPCNIYDSVEALKDLSTCDLVFGCMDSIDGRHLLNRLATFYSLPYFDVGVKLIADGEGGVSDISTAVHYLLPGQSLLKRKVYNHEELRAADLKRDNSEMYEAELEAKYIENADVESPAVISVNMRAASDAFNEFMDRVHHLREYSETANNAIVKSSLLQTTSYGSASKEDEDEALIRYIGRGNMNPFLERIHFSNSQILT